MVKVTVDSGAVTTVGPRAVCAAFPIEETPASKAGKHFVGANGSVIKNYGVRKVTGRTKREGHEIRMPIQAADVMKILASVHQMMHAGNRVVVDSEGSYIQHKQTGRRTEMRDDGGGFTFEMLVPRKVQSSFQRQVAALQTLSEQI